MSEELIMKEVVDPETGEVFYVHQNALKQNAGLPMLKITTGTINSMLICGKQFEYKRVHGIPAPLSPMFVLSGVFHRAAKKYFQHYLNFEAGTAESEPGYSTLSMWFEVLWKEEMEREPWIDWNTNRKNPEKNRTPNEWLALGLAFCKMYEDDFLPRIKPVKIDIPFAYRIGKTDYIISGKIDLEAVVDGADTTSLINYKFSGRKLDDNQLARSIDGHAAAMHYFMQDKRRKRPVSFHIHQGVDRAKPGFEEFQIERTRFHVEWYVAQVTTIIQQIQAGLFIPNTQGFACGEGCDYWDICQGEAAQEKYTRTKSSFDILTDIDK